uniref:Reverse transcriptase domain-containing protein n=1 Tax=Tanacetum cinerariifolium TaxID=118510 RepID=A0A6L2JZD4_TANCI|nr:reverse transcriptase domain-containing protein [Tanacetum cinerariifolium]
MEGKSIQRSDEQRNLYKALVKAYDADKTILDSYRESAILKKRREEDDDQEGPSAVSDWGSKRRREGGEHASTNTPSEPATTSATRSTTGTQSRQLSASESAFVEEPVQTTCQMEASHPPRRPPTPDRDWNKTLPAAQGNAQSWISALAKQTDACSSFNELLDTPIDISNFIMNRLGVDTLTPELLASPTYELKRGSCNSLTELEYHLEEVYKATTDQLDWVNPKGQQYPHNLLQPLPLIPDNRGRRVIPFEHFINNDLEYLQGDASSQKYTTSVTKTKAGDYGDIKWIEDLVPRTMWIQEPLNYNKHALWGVSYWGRKRQQFYGFAINRESALDVYSKRRIIAVTDLKIVEWHNYKHLDWISDVYEEYRHSAACERSSTGSRKLPEEAQPYKASHVSIRSKAMRSVYCLFEPKRIYLSKQRQEKQEKSEKLGRVPTEMELILEHTQQVSSQSAAASTVDTGSSRSSEVEVAFKGMKQLIAELPMLTAPKEKEELIMYLAAAKEAINAVLMTEKDGKQVPIYFVSRALQGPEINYTPMKKLILALVSAKVTGRLLKWRFELGEHDIQYRPRTSVKGQILADFIVECLEDDTPDTSMEDREELLNPWILFTDGPSCIDGFRAGLIITNLEGMKFTYALRFRFNATNNEAEYKPLIAGLRIAGQMEVPNI